MADSAKCVPNDSLRWQQNRNLRAFSELTVCGNAAGMRLDDSSSDRHPEARATLFGGVERIKDVFDGL